MANVTQLIRRQSSRDLHHQRSVDRFELELESRLVTNKDYVSDYGATNHGFDPGSPIPEDDNKSPLAIGEGVGGPGAGEGGSDVPESWDSKAQFILATIGYAVGLGNIWRFPYLAQKNGGGAFLIPYAIMLAFLGLPLFYLELALGQRMRKGSLGAWKQISPYMGGVGIAAAVVSFLVALYYNTVIAWCLYYLFQSFQSPLPWSDCPHAIGVVEDNATAALLTRECDMAGPTQYFWYRDTLIITDNIDTMGELNWKIVGCMAIAWFLIYICIMKGIVASGKVVHVTTIFPYAVLLMFFFRGVTLPGMTDGLLHFFTPRWEKLQDPVVWLEAGTQIFFSLGLGFGGLIAFGSYNPVDNNCLQDALLVSFTNCVTSLFAGIVVFSILGFKAHETHDRCLEHRNETLMAHGFTSNEPNLLQLLKEKNITLAVCDIQEELEKSAAGTGLAFIIFTEAINQFPFPPIWAVLFFSMLFTLGADSQFGTLEGVISALVELKFLPQLRKELLTGAVCFVCFIISLVLTPGSGNYIFQLFDSFAGNIPLLTIGLCECLGISYVYGIKRFASDVELMTGSRPALYWLLCWKVLSPVIMICILLAFFSKLVFEGSVYLAWDALEGIGVHKSLPHWAMAVGIFLMALPLIWIPIIAISNAMGRNLLSEEPPCWFPEKELRSAHNLVPQRYTALERMLLCISVSNDSFKSTDAEAPGPNRQSGQKRNSEQVQIANGSSMRDTSRSTDPKTKLKLNHTTKPENTTEAPKSKDAKQQAKSVEFKDPPESNSDPDDDVQDGRSSAKINKTDKAPPITKTEEKTAQNKKSNVKKSM